MHYRVVDRFVAHCDIFHDTDQSHLHLNSAIVDIVPFFQDNTPYESQPVDLEWSGRSAIQFLHDLIVPLVPDLGPPVDYVARKAQYNAMGIQAILVVNPVEVRQDSHRADYREIQPGGARQAILRFINEQARDAFAANYPDPMIAMAW